MKSTISFDLLTIVEFCELGALDIAYELSPKINQQRFITLEGYICFTDVKWRQGVAEIDWKEFSYAMLLSKYKPALVCEGGLFRFMIESPNKEYSHGKTLLSGHESSVTHAAFTKIPFINLPRQFESVAA